MGLTTDLKEREMGLTPPSLEVKGQCLMPYSPWLLFFFNHGTKPTVSPMTRHSHSSSGTQWSEDLFQETSQHNEPPIPGPIQSSESHEDTSTHEPEPEVAPRQSREENFACPDTHCSIIIIDNTPVGSPPVPPPSTPIFL
ncbi:hypothetical protein O181_096292 [Austropuccinia psidii MF-1]|uniref:Uncharacterized protein n=1 Tax=Austropuccinia psidii MF-1 TaxID=1389203 RepID=A0A9Q3J6Z9_9BASI|nr:hypothetical protein [Austropuccinia psidii MF-1]